MPRPRFSESPWRSPSPLSASADVGHWVGAFRGALDRDPGADLGRFLPPRDHILYLAALGELARLDLARRWSDGSPRPVAEYVRRFPALLESAAVLEAVAREEYVRRKAAGEGVSPGEYRSKFRVDTSAWDTVGPSAESDEYDRYPATTPPPTAIVPAGGVAAIARPLSISAPDTSVGDYWGDVAESLPEAGTEFLGFRLVEELGRGAFGRVFLARQGDLAGRPVALKVAADIVGESQTLAQLQHTNIVPIYSVHRAGPLQAVCMPYFGRTTLADVLRHLGGRPTACRAPAASCAARSTG